MEKHDRLTNPDFVVTIKRKKYHLYLEHETLFYGPAIAVDRNKTITGGVCFANVDSSVIDIHNLETGETFRLVSIKDHKTEDIRKLEPGQSILMETDLGVKHPHRVILKRQKIKCAHCGGTLLVKDELFYKCTICGNLHEVNGTLVPLHKHK